MTEIYPLTIVSDRYDGVYSGGTWTAWNLEFHKIPEEIESNDIVCATWWSDFNAKKIRLRNMFGEKVLVGKGSTPQSAMEDLERKLDK